MAFIRKNKGMLEVYFNKKTDFRPYNIWNKHI